MTGHVIIAGNTFYPSTLPGGFVQYRCPYCSCNVNPRNHVPDSEDCAAAAAEREWSRSE